MLARVVRKQDMATVMRESHAEHASGAGLKKVLGVRDLVSFGVSSTLGSGIFVTVGTIATLYSGPGLFLTFIVAGFGSLLSAYCYAEFASRLPVSGQSYTYCYVSLGELAAFLIGWLSFLSYSVATAAVARGWANYVDCFVRAIRGSTLPSWLVNQPVEGFDGVISLSGLAAGLNVVCTVLACFGVHESTRISFILVVVNFGMMIAFSVYGAVVYGEFANLEPVAPFGVSGIIRGSGLAFFCCIGWELVCTLSEEVRNPARDLPRGILGSLGAVTALYCAVCLTLCAMVPYGDISVGAPIADAFKYHSDSFGYLIISLVCVTVCPPSVLTGLMGPPRVLYKMAKDGLLWEGLGRLNSHGAPAIATVICGSLSALLGGVLEFESLASCCSAVTLFMFVVVCLGVIIVRANEAYQGLLPTQQMQQAKSRLGLSLVSFCLASFAFSLTQVASFNPHRAISYALGFVNLITGALVVHFFQVVELGRKKSVDTPIATHCQPLIIQSPKGGISALGKRGKKLFLCPLVPFLPLLAAWVDIVMMTSLGAPGIGGLASMLISGLLVYFFYSVHHSKLGQM